MAEDLRRRLHFGDPGLCLGAVAKLYSQVVKQKKKIAGTSGVINGQTPEITELKILWDQCIVKSDSVSFACSETLVSLVRDGHADFSYIMRGLLNVIPSAVNCVGAVQALRQLLLLDMNACIAAKGTYRCRFGLRNPPHPFISVLTSRPDCWPSILQEVSKLVYMTDERYSCHIVRMLSPFLSYVLLNPTTPYQLTTFKVLLAETLLQAGTSTSPVAVDICVFFLDCLHQMKINSLQELSEVNVYLVKLADAVQSQTAIDKTLLKSLAIVAFMLCKECVTFGHDVTSCLKVVGMVMESGDEVELVDESVICCLSWLMLEVPLDQLKGLLLVAWKVINACEHKEQTYTSSLKLLLLPLLRVISTPVYTEVTVETQERSTNQKQASQLLSSVSRIVQQAKRTQFRQKTTTLPNQINAWYQLMQSCGQLSHTLIGNPKASHDWLLNLQSNLSAVDRVSPLVVLLVASLFWETEAEVVRASLNVLIDIASRDCSWAPSLLPLLLYRLSQEHDPAMTYDLLSAMPKTATHKVCVTSVMRALQSLAMGDAALTPMVLRLTTQLWKLQDRCFPHLQKLLCQSSAGVAVSEDTAYELLLAKAASIRDVCELRPNRGADLLPLLSKLLNECTSDVESSIAAMALDALYTLCQAEVVDLRTIWAVLAPKLTKDKRPLVMQNLCKLLGSTPGLLADSPDYEDFCDEVVDLLWEYSNHGNPVVSSAAFTALANFHEDDFTLDDLPPEITREEKAKIEKAKRKETGDKTDKKSSIKEEEDEEEYEVVPPSCYVKLLMNIHEEVLPAYQVFLSSLLVEEVRNLPRGVYKSSVRQRQQTASRSRTLDSVPYLLLGRFERVKQPGLKPGLAVGLLCCFEPKRETSQRDNKPARRHVINKGRAYQHMINTLMNEVRVESTNWFEQMQLPHAWTSLMQNALPALIQSRCAELELQRSHGHLQESPADFQAKLNAAWLWVRDKMTDQIKTAAKTNSLAQSNSVLALASLAVVTTHHFLAMDSDDDSDNRSPSQSSSQHAGQTHWLGVVVDTLLSLLGVQPASHAKIFTWYQQHSAEPWVGLPTAVYGDAALALALLAPFLLTTNTQQLHRILDVLIEGLPGQPKSRWSPDVQMHHGMALGMLTARLYEEHYLDYTGSEGEVRMIRIVDALESASLNISGGSTFYTALWGLALTLCAMTTEGAVHTKAHVANVHNKLVARLDEDDKDTLFVEALCMCIGCVTAAGFHSNIISPAAAFDVAVKLQTRCQENDQNTGLAVSTGIMFHCLVGSSHPSVAPLLANLFSTWSSTMANQTASVSQKTAAMHGLTGLVTGTGMLMQCCTHSQITSDMHAKRITVVKHIHQVLSDWSDPRIQNAASFLLGYLHLVSSAAPESNAGIPASYSYLPETSILRACMDQLILASKTGPELVPPSRLGTVLSSLAGRQGAIPPLPPVNWTTVLSPILRLPYGENVHGLCMELALSQCQRPSSSLLCVTAWLSPSIFTTLTESCKSILYGSLPALIRVVPASKLKLFVETNLLEPFRAVGALKLDQCEVIVDGLLAALRIPDPPQGVVVVLHKAVKDVYRLVPASSQKVHGRVLAKLAQCVCHLPGQDIDAVTSPLAQGSLLKSTFVRSYIVCQGQQSLMWLNPCVDVAMNVADSSQHQSVIWTLLVALAQCDSHPSQHTASMPQVHWLLELMGHARNIAHDKTQLAPNRPIHKAVQILLDVFSAAIIAWSSSDLPLVLGLAPSWLPAHHTRQGPGKMSTSGVGFRPVEQQASKEVLQLLPYSLPMLLKMEPWSQIIDKVLNWLLDMHDVECDMLSSNTKTHLKATILSLRHTPAFKTPACWTRIHSL